MRTLIIFLLLSLNLIAQNGWYLHSNWGYMHRFNSVLAIHSTDGDIVHKASWESKAFEDSPYYTLRVENWKGNKVSGLEWVHHKIYLKNNPSTIQDLSISDGYNMLFYNIGKRMNDLIYKWGVGVVIAHPDVTLTGRSRFWNDGGISGAYFAGFATQYSLEKWFYQTKHHVFTLEGKVTAHMRESQYPIIAQSMPMFLTLLFSNGWNWIETTSKESQAHRLHSLFWCSFCTSLFHLSIF